MDAAYIVHAPINRAQKKGPNHLLNLYFELIGKIEPKLPKKLSKKRRPFKCIKENLF